MPGRTSHLVTDCAMCTIVHGHSEGSAPGGIGSLRLSRLKARSQWMLNVKYTELEEVGLYMVGCAVGGVWGAWPGFQGKYHRETARRGLNCDERLILHVQDIDMIQRRGGKPYSRLGLSMC